MDYNPLKLENQICFPLYAASRKIIKLYTPLLEPLGITYTQYITLLALWERDGETVKALGERLFLDSGTLTPLLKKLESQGLVDRRRSHEDERQVFIHLTEKGKALRELALEVPHKIVSCVDMSMEDAMELYRLLYLLLKEEGESGVCSIEQ
ncbi:MarR family winged helix-turn-helix transcriptional regulator [Anaerotalea alkaliphila]|uniref:MarR family transcriptional regulator n=1 Tax=Anaerotalea alkaliphila TaxID=2662126 RepID=A0A7X5HV97_9FIRM|nr:MarR family transcriptional regulator [Anaerotalea alkaliphila]NDL67136.1 MarR family transcriptional regulator [Anaerotalea alkaliphila]